MEYGCQGVRENCNAEPRKNNKPDFITYHGTKPLSSRTVNKPEAERFQGRGEGAWVGARSGGCRADCCPSWPEMGTSTPGPWPDGLPASSPHMTSKGSGGREAGGQYFGSLLLGTEKALTLSKVTL